jgi:putative sporulation protein YtxC
MTHSISIATAEHPAAVRQRLAEELLQLKREGLDVNLSETHRGNLTLLGCDISSRTRLPPGEAQLILRYFIANALADVIVDHWQENLVRELVREECRHFTAEERKEITDIVLKRLDETWDANQPTPYLQRRNQIVKKLVEYLETSHFLVLEGFIRFRLGEYREELRELVNRAADDYAVEKEYQEFIRLLRYFVDLQGPQLPEVQVVLSAGDRFELFDAENRALCNEGFGDRSYLLEELNHGDILISTLIALSPTHITLHQASSQVSPELTDTIKDVFAGRVDFCPGCPLCRPQS